ncbi:HupE / UreJ protein [Altererythrobacter xiamenensis]|uniref:HupE / UreJ protein n=1 Tax=Altererythrobacter xiamenensis TaxID=1316679 RepID=A0A1Y6FBK0_9SPHN|nr:HupE/UreJ family protein [Altererythrobacter xiamenensis]SMQ69803.1 HupE / UreJ protein [Altererythrobacter xiamenensis]
MRNWIFIASVLLAACLALLPASGVKGHTTPDSQVTLHIHDRRIVADVIIPASEYGYATGNLDANDEGSLKSARAYIAAHASIADRSGEEWDERIDNLRFATVSGPKDLLATITFTAPGDAVDEAITLSWSPVLEQTPDHFATVLVQREGSGEAPELAGLLRQGDTQIEIPRGRSGFSIRFGSAMRLGIEHIMGGLDHLAFLLVLLLAAPLVAKNGRWQGLRNHRGSIRALVILATGFTIGHSLTLVGVVLSGATLPGSVVEPAIAATVLITAVHAVRPIFARRELVVAIVFGLIHGLGFAGFVQQTEAQVGRSMATLAGFNIGIEVIQVALIVLFVPVLLWLERKALYRPVRLALASLVGAMSVYWIVSRIGLIPG